MMYSVIGIALLKAIISIYRIITTSAPDFAYYYQAGQELYGWVGNPIHLLPPASALIYTPLVLFPFAYIQAAWVIGSFVCFLWSTWILCRIYCTQTRTSFVFVAALAYLSFPVQFTLGMGQVNLIALAIIILAVHNDLSNRSAIAGVLTAVAVLLKPELILLMPVYIMNGKIRMATVLCMTLIGAVSASVLIWGTASYAEYFGRMIPVFSPTAGLGIYYNQSLNGLLVRAGIDSPYVPVIVSGIILVSTLIVLRKAKRKFPETIWIFMPAFILAEPIAWQHHLVFLLPTYIYLWFKNKQSIPRILLGISAFLVSWNFVGEGFPGTIPLGWLIASHATVGVIILWIMGMKGHK